MLLGAGVWPLCVGRTGGGRLLRVAKCSQTAGKTPGRLRAGDFCLSRGRNPLPAVILGAASAGLMPWQHQRPLLCLLLPPDPGIYLLAAPNTSVPRMIHPGEAARIQPGCGAPSSEAPSAGNPPSPELGQLQGRAGKPAEQGGSTSPPKQAGLAPEIGPGAAAAPVGN